MIVNRILRVIQNFEFQSAASLFSLPRHSRLPGGETTLAFRLPGEHFGEMGAFVDDYPTCCARACVFTVCCFLECDALYDIMLDYSEQLPDLFLGMLDVDTWEGEVAAETAAAKKSRDSRSRTRRSTTAGARARAR